MASANNIVDLVKARSPEPVPIPIRDRISRRISVLKAWLANGIPDGKLSSLPTSLRQAKDWKDESLGILPIGSPNDFTTKHATWGSDVATIARLLTQLRQRHARPKGMRRTNARAAEVPDMKLVQSQLAEIVSQWHAARDEVIAQRNRADAETFRAARLTEAIAQKEAEIAELRRHLMQTGTGLRAID